MSKSTRYPEKTTLNLAIRERTMSSPSRLIPIVALLALLIGLFAKFAVVDRLLAVTLAQRDVAVLEQQLAALDAQNEGYDDLLTEYARHSSGWMRAEEVMLFDRAAIFALLERDVLPSASLRSFSVTENMLTLDLSQLSLQDASDIVSRLTARSDVVGVTMSTAAQGQALDNTRTGAVSMTITLTNSPSVSDDAAEGGQ